MYCRPVVGLDGCFLKGSFKGEILSEVRRDCNNQIFPIAWAMAEVENRKTWAWFLNNLQHDLGLGDGDGCTLLSDMQKVENHVPPSSQIPSASSSQTSRVPLSSEIQSPPYSQTSCVSPSSQISSHASSQTSHVPPSSQILSAPKSTPTMVFMPTPSIQQLSELVPVNQYKGTSNMREHVRAHSPKGEQLCKELAYTEMRKQDYRF
ncbi:hypothetical protein V6N11_018935 [Hibiscus sabdariffa]|uniref:MULE transposase domain-containing protein n=1 Tax=Hibiscus sabdariffa TaxID=183260 RepID=A0ABR2R0V0_9ROSI